MERKQDVASVAGAKGCYQSVGRSIINMAELVEIKYESTINDMLGCGRASKQGAGDQHLHGNSFVVVVQTQLK